MVGMLYGWFYQEILNYLSGLSRNRAQAEDLTQDTFMRAMANAHKLMDMEKAACRAWLYRTAKNLFIDSARRQQREALLLAPPDGYEQDFSAVLIQDALSHLPWEDQRLFRLRYLEGYNASEIGEMYGLPPATVRTRLTRARKKLRDVLDDHEGDDKG